MKHFRSVVSLLLVFVLCFGMIPCAFADEITTPTVPQSGEGSASEAVPPNTDQAPPPEESTAPPEESTEPPSEEATEPMEEVPTDETTLPEELDDLDSDDRLLGAEAYASTQKSIMLFDFADNGDYTTRLNYQVSCAYKPNGSGTTRTAYVKNMGWHFARYGGVAHADEPLYCIEPWRNYAGWKIGLYTDSACTNPVSGSPFTTGSDGTVTVSGLLPGTLYAKEIPTGDSYWGFDTAVKTVVIQANQTASVTFTNTHYGCIQIVKTTNTGNNLGDWTFRVRDANGKTVGDYTTDENGYTITGNLPLGRYTVVELPTEDAYWAGELGFHTVLVTGGKDAVDTWLNREQGLVYHVVKSRLKKLILHR